MPYQVVETKEKVSELGTTTRNEFFDFGCRSGRYAKLGKLQQCKSIGENHDRWGVHLEFGGSQQYGYHFSSRSEADDFIENSLSSKESLISAHINKEQNYRGNIPYEFCSMSKFLKAPSSPNLSFKRWNTNDVWEIFDESTGENLGEIKKGDRWERHPYKLVLAYKFKFDRREIIKSVGERPWLTADHGRHIYESYHHYRREIASFDSKKEAVSYAEKILSDGFDVEDLLYMSRWKECMTDMENFEWL